MTYVSVDGGHRAIIFSRLGGVQKEIMSEGLHFRIPWFHYPIIYDIRSRPRKISSPTGSKDLQMVNISLRVLSRPDASTLPSMYRQLGLDYDEKVMNYYKICYIIFFYFRPNFRAFRFFYLIEIFFFFIHTDPKGPIGWMKMNI